MPAAISQIRTELSTAPVASRAARRCLIAEERRAGHQKLVTFFE